MWPVFSSQYNSERMKSFVALQFCLLAGICLAEPWKRTKALELDGKVTISWNISRLIDNGVLDLQVVAPTEGYVGLGFSLNGAMRGSDIVVGWVDRNGQGHLKDMYGIGNQMPELDRQQDYKLVSAKQEEGKTIIRFQRPLSTCDAHDLEITNDTIRVIWAYEDRDPQVLNETSLAFSWHGGKNRGAKSVFLIDTPLAAPFPDDTEVPDPAIKHWDVYLHNASVNGEESAYICKIIKAPKLDRKHHMIGHRSLIKNKKNVHHLCLYECTVPENLGGTAAVFEKHLEHPAGRCYSKNMPPDWGAYCGGFFQCWVAGGEGEMFPEHVGAVIGEEHGGTTYFMLEVHYDNPERLTFTDTSGVRIFYTDQLRDYDGGTLLASFRITPFLLIPPKQTDFNIYGICSSECTAKTIPKNGIKIFGVLLHAHLAGRSIRLRHFRDGKELPLISQDKSYDFNYQQTRYLNEEVTVLPGDELMTECTFETLDRNRSVLGGLSSKEEMCQSFLLYYPKIELSLCSSQYEFYDFFNTLGVQNVTGDVFAAMHLPYNPTLWPKEKQLFDPPDDAKELENLPNGTTDIYDLMTIVKPATLEHNTVGEYLQHKNWNDRKASKLIEKQWKHGKQYAYCTLSGRRRIPLDDFIINLPRGETPKIQEDKCTLRASGSSCICFSWRILLPVAIFILSLLTRLANPMEN